MIDSKKIDLGYPFNSLTEAKEILQPNQVIITEESTNKNAYYIVDQEKFLDKYHSVGYKIV